MRKFLEEAAKEEKGKKKPAPKKKAAATAKPKAKAANGEEVSAEELGGAGEVVALDGLSLSIRAVNDKAERAALKEIAEQQSASQTTTLGDLLAVRSQ